MKLYNGSKKTGILLIALLVLSTLSTEVLAESTLLETQRSCKASYFAMIKSFSYTSEGDRKMIHMGYGKMMVPVKGHDFLISEDCSSFTNKNQCRKRARDKLIECGWSHAKSPTSYPDECRNTWIYPIRSRVPLYPFPGSVRLMDVVKEHVCARPLYPIDYYKRVGLNVTSLFPKTYTAEFILGIKTWGDKGCGSKNPGRFTTLDGDRYERKAGSNSRHLFTPLKRFTITCP